MSKFYIAALLAIVCALSTYSLASADVGELQDCFAASSGSSGGYTGGGSTTFENAQTFTPTESYTLGALKLNIRQHITEVPGTINISIRETTLSGGQQKPNATVLTTEIVAGTTFPVITVGPSDQSNVFSCSATTLPSQVVELTTPIFVTAGTTYAIVVQRNDSVGSGTTFYWWGSLADAYAAGVGFTNGTTFNENTPADWSDASHDFDFATFDNIITSEPARDINSWLTNFLTSLGMNSTGGKLFIGSGFALILLLTLLLLKVPFLLALGFGGIISIVLVSALLISQAAFLAMLSLAGIAILGRLLLGSGGEATD